MRCFICTVLYASLMASSHWVPVSQQAGNQRLMQIAPLDQMQECIKYWEGLLAREIELQTKGASSQREIDDARVVVASARHDLALWENKFEVALKQSRLILDIREKEMKRMQGMIDYGVVSDLEITQARRQLAWARLHLASKQKNDQVVAEQLPTIVELCKKELSILKKLSPHVVSPWYVHRAENRLICAQYLLTKMVSDIDEFVKNLRQHVEICEKEWKNEKEMKLVGATTFINLYVVHNTLLNAKLRLASAEGNTDGVIVQLRSLIKLHEETLPQVQGMHFAELERNLRFWVLWDLACDRMRLEKTLGGNQHINDHAATAIDW